MLYLLEPNEKVTWVDLPHSVTAAFVREHGLDLEALEWSPAELKLDSMILRLAVRFGLPARRGLVVDGGTVSEYARIGRMIETHDAANVAQERVKESNGPLMEALMPGWTERTRELDARVNDSVRQAIAEAVADLDEQLSEQPDDQLAQHWRRLGGVLPSPL